MPAIRFPKAAFAAPAVFACVFSLLLAACAVNKPARPSLRGNAALQSGPMLGYTDMFESLIWVQAKTDAAVKVEYWDSSAPDTRYETATVHTNPATGHTAKCIADKVQPGKKYQYRVLLNGEACSFPYPTTFQTQTLWQWRTDPPVFSVATGSCAYVNEEIYDRPGKPYGSNYQIYTNIAAQKPDMMVWLGDNIYYREPDWNTRTGMVHRNTHTRSLPELQQLWASTHHYAIWDDHDYGPDNSDGTWIHKDMAAEIFEAFWGNPTYGLPGRKGCTTHFTFQDVEFFLLDNRYYRTPNNCESCPRTALGAEQLAWFKGAIAASRAPFKIVAIGGQVLTNSTNGETLAHDFEAERDSLLAHIERENIKGVVFLTGDKHFTELSAYKNKKENWVYDLTTSPFTSGPFSDADIKEKNQYRVPGTVFTKHNFSILKFSGPRTAREMQITVIDADGKTQWTRTISVKNGYTINKE